MNRNTVLCAATPPSWRSLVSLFLLLSSIPFFGCHAFSMRQPKKDNMTPGEKPIQYKNRMPPNADTVQCPCGASPGVVYGNCCGPYHRGIKKCDSAVDVLRTRFSAFKFRHLGYFADTTHPDSKEFMQNRNEWIHKMDISGMFDSFEFVNVQGGSQKPSTSNQNSEAFLDLDVRMRANYDTNSMAGPIKKGQELVFKETSRFLQTEQGNWLFADSQVHEEVKIENAKNIKQESSTSSPPPKTEATDTQDGTTTTKASAAPTAGAERVGSISQPHPQKPVQQEAVYQRPSKQKKVRPQRYRNMLEDLCAQPGEFEENPIQRKKARPQKQHQNVLEDLSEQQDKFDENPVQMGKEAHQQKKHRNVLENLSKQQDELEEHHEKVKKSTVQQYQVYKPMQQENKKTSPTPQNRVYRPKQQEQSSTPQYRVYRSEQQKAKAAAKEEEARREAAKKEEEMARMEEAAKKEEKARKEAEAREERKRHEEAVAAAAEKLREYAAQKEKEKLEENKSAHQKDMELVARALTQQQEQARLDLEAKQAKERKELEAAQRAARFEAIAAANHQEEEKDEDLEEENNAMPELQMETDDKIELESEQVTMPQKFSPEDATDPSQEEEEEVYETKRYVPPKYARSTNEQTRYTAHPFTQGLNTNRHHNGSNQNTNRVAVVNDTNPVTSATDHEFRFPNPQVENSFLTDEQLKSAIFAEISKKEDNMSSKN